MTEIVQFPGATSERPIMEGDIDEIHAEAFRDIEGHIGDCATMAEITSRFVMANAQCTDERLVFSVFHLEMLLNLKKYYYAAYQGDDAILAKRLITSPAKTTRELKETYGSLPAEEKNEAPAPIGTEAQPAAAGGSCQAAEAMKGFLMTPA